MAKLERLAGSTGHILTVFIQDSSKTDGSGLTGLTNASANLACAYKRNSGSAAQVVSLDTIVTLGTYGSYAANHAGFKEIDSVNLPGFYEFQPPDAAFAAGAKSVAFLLHGAANMVPAALEFDLTAVDNQDALAYGMGRLDAAVSSRSTFAGGVVASVTAPVTVGTNNDKTGYALAGGIALDRGTIVSATSTAFTVSGLPGADSQYRGRRLFVALTAGGQLVTDDCIADALSGGNHLFTFATAQNKTPAPGDAVSILGA